jgi:hypothetical protein
MLSPALGLLFFDHAINIKKIGTYIDRVLRPALVEILASSSAVTSIHLESLQQGF